jgi:hypothetical protein
MNTEMCYFKVQAAKKKKKKKKKPLVFHDYLLGFILVFVYRRH